MKSNRSMFFVSFAMAALFIQSVAWGGFPVTTNNVSLSIAQPTGGWDGFNWRWIGRNDQVAAFRFRDFDATDMFVAFRMARASTTYLDVTPTNAVISTTNVFFSIPYTNVPPDATYYAEVVAFEGGDTNAVRTLAQGKITVLNSLFGSSDTNYTYPTNGLNLGAFLPNTNGYTFPVHTNTSLNSISAVKGGWDNFTWRWMAYDDQVCVMSLDTATTGFSFAFKASRDGVAYILVEPTGMTQTGTNVSFAIGHLGVPPDGTYFAELWGFDGANTNLVRTFSQGKIIVNNSLFDDGDTAFPYPTNGVDMANYLTVGGAATTYYPLTNPSNYTANAATASNLADVAKGMTNYVDAATGAVVVVETDPVFTNWLATGTVSTVESDPVFTNWVATNAYVKAEADTNALAQLAAEIVRATNAEAGLYPRNNPSGYVDRAAATSGMQVAGSYLTSEADTLSTVLARGRDTTNIIEIGASGIMAAQAPQIRYAAFGLSDPFVTNSFLFRASDPGVYSNSFWRKSGSSYYRILDTEMPGDASTLDGLDSTAFTTNPAAGTGYLAMSNGVWTSFAPGGGADGGATNIAAGAADEYDAGTRTLTWNTNAVPAGGGGDGDISNRFVWIDARSWPLDEATFPGLSVNTNGDGGAVFLACDSVAVEYAGPVSWLTPSGYDSNMVFRWAGYGSATGQVAFGVRYRVDGVKGWTSVTSGVFVSEGTLADYDVHAAPLTVAAPPLTVIEIETWRIGTNVFGVGGGDYYLRGAGWEVGK